LSNNLFHRSRYLCTLFIVLLGAAALDAVWTTPRIVSHLEARSHRERLGAIFLLVIALRFLPTSSTSCGR
jgi:hypothetical protein